MRTSYPPSREQYPSQNWYTKLLHLVTNLFQLPNICFRAIFIALAAIVCVRQIFYHGVSFKLLPVKPKRSSSQVQHPSLSHGFEKLFPQPHLPFPPSFWYEHGHWQWLACIVILTGDVSTSISLRSPISEWAVACTASGFIMLCCLNSVVIPRMNLVSTCTDVWKGHRGRREGQHHGRYWEPHGAYVLNGKI